MDKTPWCLDRPEDNSIRIFTTPIITNSAGLGAVARSIDHQRPLDGPLILQASCLPFGTSEARRHLRVGRSHEMVGQSSQTRRRSRVPLPIYNRLVPVWSLGASDASIEMAPKSTALLPLSLEAEAGLLVVDGWTRLPVTEAERVVQIEPRPPQLVEYPTSK